MNTLDQPVSYAGSDPDIFVSYAHIDKDYVFPQIATLQKHGYSVWFDEGIRAGSEWSKELAEAIRASKSFVFFASPNSTVSRHCLNELHFALGLNKPLLAVYEEELELTPQLELLIGGRQRIVRQQHSSGDYQFRLLNALETLSEAEDAPVTDQHRRSKVTQFVAWATRVLRSSTSPASQRIDRRATSICVLPFTTQASELASITQFMGDDLIGLLASNPGVMLLGENNRSGARYLIAGELRARGNEVEFRVDLTDTQTSETLWTKKFRHAHDHVVDAQAEVIESIARHLGPAIWYSEGLRLQREPPANLAAWELVQKAEVLEFEADFDVVENLARRAITLDANYAPALATLARILSNRVVNLLSNDRVSDINEMVTLANKALVLAPNDSKVLYCAAVVKMTVGDLDASLRLARRAAETDPTGPLSFMGPVLIGLGHPREGIEAIRSDMSRIEDNNRLAVALTCLAAGYQALEEYDAAEDALKEVLALKPNMALPTLLRLAGTQVLSGDQTGALDSLAQAQRLDPTLTEKIHTGLVANSAPLAQQPQIRSLLQALWATA